MHLRGHKKGGSDCFACKVASLLPLAFHSCFSWTSTVWCVEPHVMKNKTFWCHDFHDLAQTFVVSPTMQVNSRKGAAPRIGSYHRRPDSTSSVEVYLIRVEQTGKKGRPDICDVQGYLDYKTTPTPQDPPRTLGIGLR